MPDKVLKNKVVELDRLYLFLRFTGKSQLFAAEPLFFLVYELNEFFAETLVSTRNLEDLGIAFFGQSLFCKCPLHL